MVTFSVIKRCFQLHRLLYDVKLKKNTVANGELLIIWTVIKYGKTHSCYWLEEAEVNNETPLLVCYTSLTVVQALYKPRVFKTRFVQQCSCYLNTREDFEE